MMISRVVVSMWPSSVLKRPGRRERKTTTPGLTRTGTVKEAARAVIKRMTGGESS